MADSTDLREPNAEQPGDMTDRTGSDVGASADRPRLVTDPADSLNAIRVALLLLVIVVMVGVVTYLGPILKPFLVAVFLFFSTKAAAGYFIRRRFPPLLAYLALFLIGSAAVAGLSLLTYGEVLALQEEWPRYKARILALIGKAPEEASQPLTEVFEISTREVHHYLFERGLGLLELLTMTFFYLLFILLGAGRLPHRVRRAVLPQPCGRRRAATSPARRGRRLQFRTCAGTCGDRGRRRISG